MYLEGVTIVEKNVEITKDIQVIRSIQRDLNIVTGALLLTGQITIIGVFVTPGGFRVSLGGPLTGESRVEGKLEKQTTNVIIDVIDVILAVLLLNDEIGVTGSFIAPGRFTINVSGPIFGVPKLEPTLPYLKRDYTFFQKVVSKHFDVNPNLLKTLTKE